VGVSIVKRAMEEPMRQIALNARAEGATVIQRCIAESDEMGYDAVIATFVNLIDAGIIDPTKVTRSALQNAASVAGLLLTTAVLIAELPEKAHAHRINGPMDEMNF
jgi:chaperonin GroEL